MAGDSKCAICGRSDASKREIDNLDYAFECPSCDKYTATREFIEDGIRPDFDVPPHVLSGAARYRSEHGRPVHLTSDNIPFVVDSARPPNGNLEKMDRILLHIAEFQKSANAELQMFFNDDYPIAFALHGDEFKFLIENLVKQGYLEHRGDPGQNRSNQFYRPTPDGWRRAADLKKSQIQSDQAFVAMRLNEEMRGAYSEGIKPALEATRWRPLIANEPPETQMKEDYDDKIDDLIIGEIRRSSLFIADFTGHRQNVYFETGLAMGLGINIIRTCQSDEIKFLHFDLRQYRCIEWDDPAELRDQLEKRIRALGLDRP